MHLCCCIIILLNHDEVYFSIDSQTGGVFLEILQETVIVFEDIDHIFLAVLPLYYRALIL